MTQSVKHLTLDFSWDPDLMVHEIEPRVRICADSAEPAWDPLPPALSAPPPLTLFLSKNKKTKTLKHTFKKRENKRDLKINELSIQLNDL